MLYLKKSVLTSKPHHAPDDLPIMTSNAPDPSRIDGLKLKRLELDTAPSNVSTGVHVPPGLSNPANTAVPEKRAPAAPAVSYAETQNAPDRKPESLSKDGTEGSEV